MFGFLRRRKLARHALPDADWERVCARLPPLAALDAAERALLRERVTLFLADKTVAGSEGFVLTPAQRIEIAAWACLPVLHIGLAAYAGFHGVIVYPEEFLAPREEMDEYGIVHEGHEEVAGESWDYGPILLSWADVLEARACDGYNVVIHECAHKLDLGDGEINGVPDLSGSGIASAEWQAVMQAAWEQVQAEEDTFSDTSIDDYALESPAEFFAVLCEHYFTAPEHLAGALPDAHALLARFFRREA